VCVESKITAIHNKKRREQRGEIITKPFTSQHGLRSMEICSILTLLHISATKPKLLFPRPYWYTAKLLF